MAELDRGHVDGLRAMYASALRSLKNTVKWDLAAYHAGNSLSEYQSASEREVEFCKGPHFWSRMLKGALKDFVYCQAWYKRRLCITDWFELETLIEAQDTVDAEWTELRVFVPDTHTASLVPDAYSNSTHPDDWEAEDNDTMAMFPTSESNVSRYSSTELNNHYNHCGVEETMDMSEMLYATDLDCWSTSDQ